LVFCEAKCADNVELWMPARDESAAGGTSIAVVAQLRKYETFIRENTDALVPAHRNVCQTLTDLHEQGSRRKLDDLVHKVANGAPLSTHPSVYLLVYGYDANQRGGALGRRLAALGADTVLGNRVIARATAAAFRLEKDIVRCLRTTRLKN